MYQKHFIVTENNEETLYLYINASNMEFATEFSYGSLDERYERLNNSIYEYLNSNNINFRGEVIKVMLGTLLVSRTSAKLLLKENNELTTIKKQSFLSYDYTRSITVKAHDTLHSISQTYGTSIWEIKTLNNLVSNLIFKDQNLIIPVNSNANIYVVSENDTLDSISKMFCVPISSIFELNNLKSEEIQNLQRIKIPSIVLKNILHTVTGDESLSCISKKYGVSESEIIKWNPHIEKFISQGDFLMIFAESVTPNFIAGYNLSSKQYITIRRVETGHIERLSLEQYIFGVLASEIPANYDFAALKVQAIVSRTFILNKLSHSKYTIINDTSEFQAYSDMAELHDIWCDKYNEYVFKVARAVYETKDLVITYDNSLINALYFSCSNGKTLSSEEYFPSSIPYLQSVNSHWDKTSPFCEQIKKISIYDFKKVLNIDFDNSNDIKLNYHTHSKSVKSVKIKDTFFSGVEFRKKFYLNSTTFDLQFSEHNVIFIMRGFGHGVGLSQYGADKMAKEGNNIQKIIKHYYTNVEIQPFSSLIKVT